MKKFDFKTMGFSDILNYVKESVAGQKNDEKMMTGQVGKYEVNLVPDIKMEMIKFQKIRNVVFFICLVVSIVSISTVIFFGGIKGTQDLLISGQEKHIKNLSDKITNYKELPDFLTIQDQLKKLSEIDKKRPVLSRVFPILKNLFPTGADTITMSELNVNLETSSMTFDAQANAGEDPKIDYRVLESFKKSVNLMKYDHGRFVDVNGNPIPTRCIKETDDNGNLLSENGNVYVIWKRGNKDCDPGRNDHVDNEDEQKEKTIDNSKNDSSLKNTRVNGGIGQVTGGNDASKKNQDDQNKSDDYKSEEKKAVTKIQTVIPDEKIWRTPQFDTWSAKKEVKTSEDGVLDDLTSSTENKTESQGEKEVETTIIKNVKNYVYTPSMDLKGKISGIPHFESECIRYSGQQTNEDGKTVVKWSAENICKMVPEGIQITDSSNGRDANNNLVLRFSAIISVDPNIFAYNTKHVMTIGPTGQNVTDSYQQIKGMFAAPAKDCRADDTECINQATKQPEDATDKKQEDRSKK